MWLANILAVLFATPALGVDTTVLVTLVNLTVEDVGGVYVAEPGGEVWSADLQPEAAPGDIVIGSGASLSALGHSGTWDLLVVDSGGAELLRVHNVELVEGATIVFSD